MPFRPFHQLGAPCKRYSNNVWVAGKITWKTAIRCLCCYSVCTVVSKSVPSLPVYPARRSNTKWHFFRSPRPHSDNHFIANSNNKKKNKEFGCKSTVLISQPQSIRDTVLMQRATCRQFAYRGVGKVSGWPRLGGKELMCVLLFPGFLDAAYPPVS